MIPFLGDPYFDKIISKVYHEDDDAIIVHVGARGSTKSGSAITTGETIDRDENGFLRFVLPINLVPKQLRPLMRRGWVFPRVVFKPSDLLRIISNPSLPQGSVTVWDETGVEGDARDFATKKNKFLKRVMETVRDRNLVNILTAPTEKSFDIGFRRTMTFFNEFQGKVSLPDGKYGKCLISETTTSGKGKTYYKRIRDKTAIGKTLRLNKYYFPKPSYYLERPYKKYKRLMQTAWYKEYLGELESMDELLKPEEERKRSFDDAVREVFSNPEKFFHPKKKKFVAVVLEKHFNFNVSEAKKLKDFLDFKLLKGEFYV